MYFTLRIILSVQLLHLQILVITIFTVVNIISFYTEDVRLCADFIRDARMNPRGGWSRM